MTTESHKDTLIQTVWARYLSADEQRAQAELAELLGADAPVAVMEGMDLASKIKAMRRGFEEFAAAFSPPLADVPMTPFAEGDVRGLWFSPTGADNGRVLLYFHGGGYILGSPLTLAAVSGFLAREAGMPCLSIDYPLAPEAPFPAAIENAILAYRLLLDRGITPQNVVFAGDSAGGGLVLAILVALRDRGISPPAGAYLLSPWTDLRVSFGSHASKRAEDTLVTESSLAFFAARYTNAGNLGAPLVSPAFADFTGLPPLLVHVGSTETLLDDAFAVARNAATSNVPVELIVWPGYGHVHQMLLERFEGGRRALVDAAKFMREVIERRRLRV